MRTARARTARARAAGRGPSTHTPTTNRTSTPRTQHGHTGVRSAKRTGAGSAVPRPCLRSLAAVGRRHLGAVCVALALAKCAWFRDVPPATPPPAGAARRTRAAHAAGRAAAPARGPRGAAADHRPPRRSPTASQPPPTSPTHSCLRVCWCGTVLVPARHPPAWRASNNLPAPDPLLRGCQCRWHVCRLWNSGMWASSGPGLLQNPVIAT